MERGTVLDIRDADQWAAATFGTAELGDPRRTRRLMKLAGQLARATGSSFAAGCGTSRAAQEGAYRFARNTNIKAKAIAEAGFAHTVKQCANIKTLLAIEDSTTLSYGHGAAEQLGDLGGKKDSTSRGFWVHSVLMVDAHDQTTVGLVYQERWMREPRIRNKGQRRERRYENKESFKWQQASQELSARFGVDGMNRVVSVCDREADIYQYLAYKIGKRERFVIRACCDRNVMGTDNNELKSHLFVKLNHAPCGGTVMVNIPQRGGRVARNAKLTLRTTQVHLERPKNADSNCPMILSVNVVLAREETPPRDVERLEWMLLTREPINTGKDMERVLRWYALRWRIEVFHKAWKSGAGVERLRMQSAGSLERIAVLHAFTAVRLMQLREMFENKSDVPCDQILDAAEWKMLWISVERTRPPQKCPTGKWAYHALGRLAGWTDTKRTGIVGWDTLWAGWLRLHERMDAHLTMRKLEQEDL